MTLPTASEINAAVPSNGILAYTHLLNEALQGLREAAESIGGAGSVKEFGAVGDGVVDDTQAFQDAHDWAYNSGTPIGKVYVPPGTYLISDNDADDVGLIWRDGVELYGDGFSSKIKATTAITIIRWIGSGGPGHSGTWKKTGISNLYIDGDDTAEIGLETVVGAYQLFANLRVVNCDRGIVVGTTQNSLFSGCQAQECGICWQVCNGAASNSFIMCGADAGEQHILIGNDATIAVSYNLLPGQPGELAGMYTSPSHNNWYGGVYERTKSGGTLENSIKITHGTCLRFQGIALAAPDTLSDVLINIATGTSIINFRDCYFFGDGTTKNLVTQNGYNVAFEYCDGVNHTGDYINVGNYTRLERNNFNVSGGKRIAKSSTASVYTEARDIVNTVIGAGGGGGNRPDATQLAGVVRYWNYDSALEEIYDPVWEIWRTVGGNLGDVDEVTVSVGAPTYTIDVRAKKMASLTLTNNATIAAPTNAVRGDHIHLFFLQDGTGGRTITFNAVFKVVPVTTGNTAAKRSSFQFVNIDGTNWLLCAAQAPWS
jgi:hypothetical protein